MKRYKDCELMCNEGQYAYELLDLIERISKEKGYNIKRQSTISNKDTLIVYTKAEELPYSRIVLCSLSNEKSIAIVNVIPMPESGTTHIGYETYNKLLDIFKNEVFFYIHEKYLNEIKETSEDYTIEEIIPRSYKKLNTWLSAYPLSSHQYDTNRWYDFIITLHQTREKLSLDDFGKYIRENYNWEEEDIEKMELKLESHLDLLEYYDHNR